MKFIERRAFRIKLITFSRYYVVNLEKCEIVFKLLESNCTFAIKTIMHLIGLHSSDSFSQNNHCVRKIITLAIRTQCAFTFRPTLLSNIWEMKHFFSAKAVKNIGEFRVPIRHLGIQRGRINTTQTTRTTHSTTACCKSWTGLDL